MFRINLLKGMPLHQRRAEGPSGAGKGKRKAPAYIAVAIAALAVAAAWVYFRGVSELEKPVTVVHLKREKAPPPTVTAREEPAPRAQIAPPAAEKKEEPAPAPAKKPEAGPRQITQVQEKKAEAMPTRPEGLKPVSSVAEPPSKKEEKLVLPRGRLPVILHVASYRSEGSARRDVRRLMKKGYPAFMADFDIPGKGTWYRVFSGRYGSTAEAKATGAALKKSGLVQYASPMNLPYSLQVGVYSSREEARKGEVRLNLLGYAATVLEAKSSDGRLYYRLLVGAYKSKDASAKTADRLKDDGYQTVLAAP